VTGADSRTAVNDAMGGKTQLVGLVAAGSMLFILFFFTEPLAFVPTASLAAVIIVAGAGLFDFKELRSLYEISFREFLLSVGTTLGVLILGVLPGVLLAVILSLLWLLTVVSRPHDGVLGRVKGMKGFHNLNDFPDAKTIPGLLLYRFDANLMFFNADYFCDRVRAAIAAAETPVEWVVLDASSISVVDITAIQKVAALRKELAGRGIFFAMARVKHSLNRFFSDEWAKKHKKLHDQYRYHTVRSAVRAFHKRSKLDASHPGYRGV
ncbi:SulP family inorganic anion transporter, partial [bacterium]|nr:SulP family inorganic anion transporter [bacterium]